MNCEKQIAEVNRSDAYCLFEAIFSGLAAHLVRVTTTFTNGLGVFDALLLFSYWLVVRLEQTTRAILRVASESLLKSEIVRQRLEVILFILVSLIAMGAKAEQSMQELRDFVASVECDGMRFFVSLVWAVAKLVFFVRKGFVLGRYCHCNLK